MIYTLPTADSWYRKPSPRSTGVPLLSAAESNRSSALDHITVIHECKKNLALYSDTSFVVLVSRTKLFHQLELQICHINSKRRLEK